MKKLNVEEIKMFKELLISVAVIGMLFIAAEIVKNLIIYLAV